MRFHFSTSRIVLSLQALLRASVGAIPAVIVGVALAFGLTSCGGGGDGVSGGGTGGGGPRPGITFSPAFSFGSVSGLGSIFVGKYEFDDAVGKVTAQDGLPVSASDLGLGVQVTVLNEKTSQTLDSNANNPTGSIQIKRLFMGILRASGPDLEIGLVNGQVVYFDRRTAVVGAAKASDFIGTLVQVAGYLEPTLNQVTVTRIERASAAQIAQNQIYITARVQSVDAASASASVGFATVSLAALQPAQTVEVNDVIRVQGSFSATSTSTLIAAKLNKIRPVPGLGGSTFRGIVNTRPTPAAPTTPLTVDGYEVQLLQSEIAVLPDVRVGALVEVQGTLDGTILKSARLVVVAGPKVLLAGEDPGPDPPIVGPRDAPKPDYVISKSPVQSVNADGSFVVRGIRVVPFIKPGSPAPQPFTVGQVISIAGEARSDASGFYVLAAVGGDGIAQ